MSMNLNLNMNCQKAVLIEKNRVLNRKSLLWVKRVTFDQACNVIVLKLNIWKIRISGVAICVFLKPWSQNTSISWKFVFKKKPTWSKDYHEQFA